MDSIPPNETELESFEPRLRFYERPGFRIASLIAVVLLFLLLIGVLFDSSYFRF